MIYYQRSFPNIAISHFNGLLEYNELARARELVRAGAGEKLHEVAESYEAALKGTHGHNLRVDITISADSLGPQGYIVPDENVQRYIIDELKDRNLSMMPGLRRATTENILVWVQQAMCDHFKVPLFNARASVKVRVWENDQIWAESEVAYKEHGT